MSTESDTVYCFIYDDDLSFDRNYQIWKSLNEKERLAYSLDLYTDDVSFRKFCEIWGDKQ
tara:strand:+ start:158 stop:337 length:180 start_codon:yes stop_codon:yes gene_type:complete